MMIQKSLKILSDFEKLRRVIYLSGVDSATVSYMQIVIQELEAESEEESEVWGNHQQDQPQIDDLEDIDYEHQEVQHDDHDSDSGVELEPPLYNDEEDDVVEDSLDEEEQEGINSMRIHQMNNPFDTSVRRRYLYGLAMELMDANLRDRTQNRRLPKDLVLFLNDYREEEQSQERNVPSKNRRRFCYICGSKKNNITKLILAVVAYASADSSEDGVSPGAKGTSCKCGWANRVSGSRIIGGRFFNKNEYPFLVSLVRVKGRKYYFTCGGSIITPNHVITAAHCLNKIIKFRSKAAVFLGAHDRREVNTTAVFVYVAHFQQHAGYIPNKSDDIAILTLASSINFNKIIGPVCMPHPGLDVSGKTVRVLGWGAVRNKEKGSNIPKKLDTTAMSSEKCNSAWGPNHTNPTHMCAFSWKGITCKGDSGGPVVWLDPQINRYILVGLVSHGVPCSGWKPTIHTRVAAYLPWIHQQIAS
ncbi:hypothetical protein GE061_010067 [Apolygus lucorum]|uniref:Peptidase S1 domain-containing protein n=1 Tax=Apolygus lucorum TaxID=248454 RepID=A0A8S9Y648_APOLU|nr:hypothetical protein GE061_010067 [Apolygus lucorum]